MKSQIQTLLTQNKNIMYKNIFTIVLFSVTSAVNAQVIIGDAVGTAPAAQKSSVLLEFAAGQNKGIIVPYVRTLPTGAALIGGSIILDATTATTARMKYYNGTSWIDLSGQDANLTNPDVMTAQPTIALAPELASSRAIIGDVPDPIPSTFPEGVLVLNSTTKAMILPIVADVQNIPSPSPGMMVYVNKSGFKRLAVYNGSKWSFWKP